jgi:hypothetical protein
VRWTALVFFSAVAFPRVTHRLARNRLGVWQCLQELIAADLRAERQNYLLMTADHLPRTAIRPRRSRLECGAPTGSPRCWKNASEGRIAGEPGAARRRITAFEQPSEGTGEVPTVTPEQPSEINQLLRTACTTALWVLLVLGGILGVLYLWRRWQASSQASPTAIEGLPPQPTVRDTGMRPFPEVADAYGPEKHVATGLRGDAR